MGNFELRYLKNKEKYEINFLILKDKKAFLAIETKLTDNYPAPAWEKFMKQLGCSYGVQLVIKPEAHKLYEYKGYQILEQTRLIFCNV